MGCCYSVSFKSDGSIGICADYKQTVNKVASYDKYAVPKAKEILTAINGEIYNVWFTSLAAVSIKSWIKKFADNKYPQRTF